MKREIREPKFRYFRDGEMKYFTLYELMYGYVDKNINHPENYAGEWSGLTDKNGKEIYEGDIQSLETTDCQGTPETILSKVFWDSKSAAFETICIKQNRIFKTGAQIGIYTDAEIIGNIYETPELIK